MKKLICLFIVCLYALTAQTQDRKVFACDSPESCIALINDLLQDSKRTYQLKEAFPYNNNSRYILEYKGAEIDSQDSIDMRVVFIKQMKGANAALEQEGVAVYELDAINGAYLDLFPVWKKHIDPSADIEALATRGYSVLKKFENTDGSGEEYKFAESDQNKRFWVFRRSIWHKTVRL